MAGFEHERIALGEKLASGEKLAHLEFEPFARYTICLRCWFVSHFRSAFLQPRSFQRQRSSHLAQHHFPASPFFSEVLLLLRPHRQSFLFSRRHPRGTGLL